MEAYIAPAPCNGALSLNYTHRAVPFGPHEPSLRSENYEEATVISLDELELSGELREQLDDFRQQVEAFRSEGELDEVQVAKLEEHFKASHIYHSAGIEGNRLTLQETVVVLRDGLDFSGKSLKDSLEVKRLGEAFDFLTHLTR